MGFLLIMLAHKKTGNLAFVSHIKVSDIVTYVKVEFKYEHTEPQPYLLPDLEMLGKIKDFTARYMSWFLNVDPLFKIDVEKY